MNCIFCKKSSESSKSVEHIIPESLGNKEHYLKKGIVCDQCNSYFATKIEKIVLEKPYFKNVRHRNFIKTKKNRLVADKVLFPSRTAGWTDLWIDEQGIIFDQNASHIINQIKDGTINKMIMPITGDPKKDDPEISRFLAKVALEFLSYRISDDEELLKEIIQDENLDPLRNYARYGKGLFWKYHQRRIYSEDDRFQDPLNHPEPYEILHELDLLYTKRFELYLVLVIMGIEYTLNFAGSETEGYLEWLEENKNISPINRFSETLIERK